MLIFKIIKDYIIIFFQNHKVKTNYYNHSKFCLQTKKIESNAELPIHYLTVNLYSEYVGFYVYMSNKFSSFVRNTFNSRIVKINNFNNFYIQRDPMSTNICIFIKVYHICIYSFILLGKLYLYLE